MNFRNNTRVFILKQLILIAVFMATGAFSFAIASVTQQVEPESIKSIFDVTNYKEVLEVTLEFDVNKLLSDRRNSEAFKGRFSFVDEMGNSQAWDTRIKMRGRFRRTKCSEMPPLKLDFNKGDLEDAGLSKFDDFKLVTQCIQDDENAKELLLKEYLVYKMYNELTDYSFRVQFLKINFKDRQSGEVRIQWGFIIEDYAQLRDRVNAEKFNNTFAIKNETLNAHFAKQVALFEYMIGNLDWDYSKRLHNVKAVKKNGQVIPIPYDFDFSGLVSASYATVNPNYPVKTIKDRLYLGAMEDLNDMEFTIKHFQNKKKTIIKMVKNFKLLKKNSRREIILYINEFYLDIDKIQLPAMVNTVSVQN